MAPSTVTATKAPSAMNTPWPKFSTSINPKTRVRPEAMMKTIRPMARPATVSVSQVEPLPIAGRASAMSAGTSAMGFQSKSASARQRATGPTVSAPGIVVVFMDGPPAGPPQGRSAPPRGAVNARSDERGGSLVGPQGQTEQPRLQAGVFSQFGHGAA